MTKKRALYIRWLQCAYDYYIGHGSTDMADAEWDHHARKFYANRAQYQPDQYPVLHNPSFTGGSLYWLKASDYPEEVKK